MQQPSARAAKRCARVFKVRRCLRFFVRSRRFARADGGDDDDDDRSGDNHTDAGRSYRGSPHINEQMWMRTLPYFLVSGRGGAGWRSAVLCCAVLCRAVPCCAVSRAVQRGKRDAGPP